MGMKKHRQSAPSAFQHYTSGRTKGVDNAFLLSCKTLNATDPLATITESADTLNMVRTLEGWDEKVPCC